MSSVSHVNEAFDNDEVNRCTPGESQVLEISTRQEKNEKDGLPSSDIIYSVNESPSVYLSAILGLQHYLTMVGGTIVIPFILTPKMCIAEDDPIRGVFLSTIIFTSGIATFLQTTFGVRLPIVQGGTFAFLIPTNAILRASFPPCEHYNFSNMTQEEKSDVWMVRIREVQGDIIVASLFQIFIGFSGIIGALLTWITPLTIVPTITLIGLSLFGEAAEKASGNWWIAIMTMALLILFSQYLSDVRIPCPSYTILRGFTAKGREVFKLFPVLLAIVLSWTVCAILTSTDVLSPSSPGRTDTKLHIIREAAWFYVPYPFQWGMPTVSIAGVVGLLAGVVSSVIESIGDYFACARLAGASRPPRHAINRGIGMEGIGCLLAGILGSGNGTTSYSENIAAIKVTKVGSRRVVQTGALCMILFGIFGKFGALFVTLPDPVVGGLFLIMFSLISAVGLSTLQFVDLNSSRNLFILGFSLFFGLAFPTWLKSHPDAINSGSLIFDEVVGVLLSTSMFVGGFLGLLLDNTIPGTAEERGLDKWNEAMLSAEWDKNSYHSTTYDLPEGMQLLFERWSWCSRVPFSPTFASDVQPAESIFTRLRKLLLPKSRTENSETPQQ